MALEDMFLNVTELMNHLDLGNMSTQLTDALLKSSLNLNMVWLCIITEGIIDISVKKTNYLK